MSGYNKTPEKGSRAWAKNEKIINKNPMLRELRDTSEGFRTGSGISTGADTSQQYKDNYDKIDFTKRPKADKPKFRVKVNGKYTDEE